MSLGKQLIEQLRECAADATKLSQLNPAGSRELIVRDDTLRARLELADIDRYSVTLRSLEVGVGSAAPVDARAYLSARAAEIARQLAYLEEPLAVWELDGGERVAQLRSSPPQHEGDELTYWEVTLRAGAEPAAHVARYHWAPNMVEREALDYPATFALIGRMTNSLAAALDEAAE